MDANDGHHDDHHDDDDFIGIGLHSTGDGRAPIHGCMENNCYSPKWAHINLELACDDVRAELS